MESARLPCCTTLSRLPFSISISSSTSAPDVSLERAPFRARRATRRSAPPTRDEKLFTKFSGFLISCAMPAVSWPKRGELFGLDQTVLGGPKILQRASTVRACGSALPRKGAHSRWRSRLIGKGPAGVRSAGCRKVLPRSGQREDADLARPSRISGTPSMARISLPIALGISAKS